MTGRAPIRPGIRDDRGGVTVEAAFAVASLVVVAILCAVGVVAVIAQVRCVDAAREAARLAARGDEPAAVEVARRIAPSGAQIDLRRAGDRVVARVSAGAPILPGLAVTADAVAALEPGVG